MEEQIPQHLRNFYKSVIRTADEIVAELKVQNNKNSEVVREVVSCMQQQAPNQRFTTPTKDTHKKHLLSKSSLTSN